MSDQDIQSAAAGYKAVYDNALSILQSRVWGGIQHLGLFEDPAEPLLTAQMRANRVMAAAGDLRPGQTVIETACGFGGTARYLAGEHGVRVHATNIAETQFVEARELTERAGLSHLVDYRYADYHDLPFPDSGFDVWWCQEALLYSVQKRRVFEEAIRVLRPGGRLIMSDLLLNENVVGAEREAFTTTMKAPNMWSIGQWDALFAGLPVKILQRQDWRAQTVHTFRRVLDNLEQAQAELTAEVGEEMVAGSFERITLQYDAAKAGKLGWCFYALQR